MLYWISFWMETMCLEIDDCFTQRSCERIATTVRHYHDSNRRIANWIVYLPVTSHNIQPSFDHEKIGSNNDDRRIVLP